MGHYSVLSASTGSFLLAIFAGISPAMTVSSILITTSIIPPAAGNTAMLEIPTILCIIRLIGIHSSRVTPIPSTPAVSPTIKVSALNTLEISFLEAPMLLSMPISFVLSNTDMYVIIPIMIEDTISEIATKAIST